MFLYLNLNDKALKVLEQIIFSLTGVFNFGITHFTEMEVIWKRTLYNLVILHKKLGNYEVA